MSLISTKYSIINSKSTLPPHLIYFPIYKQTYEVSYTETNLEVE